MVGPPLVVHVWCVAPAVVRVLSVAVSACEPADTCECCPGSSVLGVSPGPDIAVLTPPHPRPTTVR